MRCVNIVYKKRMIRLGDNTRLILTNGKMVVLVLSVSEPPKFFTNVILSRIIKFRFYLNFFLKIEATYSIARIILDAT